MKGVFKFKFDFREKVIIYLKLMTPETRPTYKHKHPELRHWLIGESGDLPDTLLAILSHASSAGVSEIRNSNLYELFARLEQEYPDLIPDLRMEQRTLKWEGKPTVQFLSYRLSEAITSALQLGLEITPRNFNHFEIAPEKAEQVLKRLRGRVGDGFVDELQPVGARLVTLLKEKQAS